MNDEKMMKEAIKLAPKTPNTKPIKRDSIAIPNDINAPLPK